MAANDYAFIPDKFPELGFDLVSNLVSDLGSDLGSDLVFDLGRCVRYNSLIP